MKKPASNGGGQLTGPDWRWNGLDILVAYGYSRNFDGSTGVEFFRTSK